MEKIDFGWRVLFLLSSFGRTDHTPIMVVVSEDIKTKLPYVDALDSVHRGKCPTPVMRHL